MITSIDGEEAMTQLNAHSRFRKQTLSKLGKSAKSLEAKFLTLIKSHCENLQLLSYLVKKVY